MVYVDRLLSRKVSYQKTAFALPTDGPSVQEVLRDIQQCKYVQQIHALRDLISQGNRDQYHVDKKRLPGVTFSATFNGKRRTEEIKSYNALLILDFDHMSKDDLRAASTVLQDDIHVLAFWASPSGEGLKGLVDLSFSAQLEQLEVEIRHRAAFNLISSYFKEKHGLCLDQSGSDVTRLCFVSSDPALHLRPDSVPFQVAELTSSVKPRSSSSVARHTTNTLDGSHASKKNLLYRTEGKNNPRDRALIGSVIKYLEKRHISITASYDQWVRVALAIANSFAYDIGKNYFLRLCRLDGAAHDEDGSIRLLESCYYGSRGSITLGTIRHYARGLGYKERFCDRDQH